MARIACRASPWLQSRTVQSRQQHAFSPLLKSQVLPPALLDHPGFPLLDRSEDFLLIPTHLRLHHFELRADQQPHLPSELVGEQGGSRLAAILLEAEPIAQLDGGAVPVGRLRTWRACLRAAPSKNDASVPRRAHGRQNNERNAPRRCEGARDGRSHSGELWLPRCRDWTGGPIQGRDRGTPFLHLPIRSQTMA